MKTVEESNTKLIQELFALMKITDTIVIYLYVNSFFYNINTVQIMKNCEKLLVLVSNLYKMF